jgi:hypothetical protein
MATTPATYNIRPQRRADYQFSLALKDSDGVPINLTGWEILAQVWNKRRVTKIGDFQVTVTDPVNGEVDLLLPYAVTDELPNEAYYDVMLISPNGLREYYLEGVVRASQGYTAPSEP